MIHFMAYRKYKLQNTFMSFFIFFSKMIVIAVIIIIIGLLTYKAAVAVPFVGMHLLLAN